MVETVTRSSGTPANKARQADDGSRTRDLELGKLALYQLSYVRAGVDSTGGAGWPEGREN